MDGYGWPPDPIGLGDWRYVLARRSLDYWRKSQWQLDKLSLEYGNLLPSCRLRIAGLIETNVKGIENAYSGLVNTQGHFNFMYQ